MATSSIKRIAVLGVGPSSAFIVAASHKQCPDAEIHLYSLTERLNSPAGAFWFHWVPEDLQQKYEVHKISVIGLGTQAEYIVKQWGVRVENNSSSFPNLNRIDTGWNPGDVWKDMLSPAEFIFQGKTTYQAHMHNYDVVFQTFPTEFAKYQMKDYLVHIPVLVFPPGSSFTSLLGTVQDKQSELHKIDAKNWVMYDGHKNCKWVRISYLFGYGYVEFPKDNTLELGATSKGKIVYLEDLHPDIPNDFEEVLPDNVFMVGRKAQFSRKMLSSDAYARTMEILEKL